MPAVLILCPLLFSNYWCQDKTIVLQSILKYHLVEQEKGIVGASYICSLADLLKSQFGRERNDAVSNQPHQDT